MLLLQQWWVYGRLRLVAIVGYFRSIIVNIDPQIVVQNITNPSKEVCCVSSLMDRSHIIFQHIGYYAATKVHIQQATKDMSTINSNIQKMW
jgi:hypothetical protein